jgi:hypothetical protein
MYVPGKQIIGGVFLRFIFLRRLYANNRKNQFIGEYAEDDGDECESGFDDEPPNQETTLYEQE